MSYRVAGVDVHKKMIAVVVVDVESDGSLSGGGSQRPPVSCTYWPNGLRNKRSRKS